LYEALREADGVPRIHRETNWVGPFCRWESKVKIWFVVSLVLCQNTLGFWESMRCEILFLRFAFLQYLDVS